MSAVTAAVLAAGGGQRLRPITDHLPKPLVPVLDRPVLEWILRDLAAAGAGRAVLNLHHLAPTLREWVGVTELPLEVSTVVEPRLTGPAGGLLALADTLAGERAVVVVSGDVCTRVDFGAVVADHLERRPALTVVTTVVADPRPVGQVDVTADGSVLGMVRDATVHLPGNLISTGIYVVAPEALAVLARLGGSVPDLDFDRHLVPELIRRGLPVAAHRTSRYWNDVGVPAALLAANTDLLGTERVSEVASPCPAVLHADVWCHGEHAPAAAEITGRVLLGPRVQLTAGAVVRGPAVLGAGTVLVAGAVVERCVTLAGTVVPAGEHVGQVLHAWAETPPVG